MNPFRPHRRPARRRVFTRDPGQECFPGDIEADVLCSRKPRKSDHDIQAIMKKADPA